MRHHTNNTLRLTFFLAAVGTGCADAGGDGTLNIDYVFGGGSPTCEEVGVEKIQISLNGTVALEADCADQRIQLDGPAGTYDLLVEGLDAQGDAVRDNLEDDPLARRVEIISGAEQSEEVRLTPTPAKLFFRWNMFVIESDTGARITATNCETAPMKVFKVIAEKKGGSSLARHDFVYCESPNGREQMPDEDRLLDGDDLAYVSVDVRDENDTRIGDLVNIEVEPPGAGKTVELRVWCIGEMACGSGDPPPE